MSGIGKRRGEKMVIGLSPPCFSPLRCHDFPTCTFPRPRPADDDYDDVGDA